MAELLMMIGPSQKTGTYVPILLVAGATLCDNGALLGAWPIP